MASAQARRSNADLGITREVQDEFAFESQQRAAKAATDGPVRRRDRAAARRDQGEGQARRRRGPDAGARARPGRTRAATASRRRSGSDPPAELTPDPKRFSPYVTGDVPFTLVERDEPIRADTTMAAMAKLPPLDHGGTVTAGNAPGVNDGAAALVLTERGVRARHGHEAVGRRSSITPPPRGIPPISRSRRRWRFRSCSSSVA